MIREDIILQEISRLTLENGFMLSSHAVNRLDMRYMDRDRVRQILLRPERLIRIDLTDSGPVYKIMGGPKRRKVAVAVVDGVVVVVTVM